MEIDLTNDYQKERLVKILLQIKDTPVIKEGSQLIFNYYGRYVSVDKYDKNVRIAYSLCVICFQLTNEEFEKVWEHLSSVTSTLQPRIETLRAEFDRVLDVWECNLNIERMRNDT